MQVTSMNPTSGHLGTEVMLDCQGAPAWADETNTRVEINGLGEGTGTHLLEVRYLLGTTRIRFSIGPMAQSGSFRVYIADDHTEFTALSSNFTVA